MLPDSHRRDAAQLHHRWWGEGNSGWWMRHVSGRTTSEINEWKKSFRAFNRYRVYDSVLGCIKSATVVWYLEPQLRWKQDKDRKQKHARISWWVWGQNQPGPIRSHLSIWKQCVVPVELWWFSDGESRLEVAARPTRERSTCLLNPLMCRYPLCGDPSTSAEEGTSTHLL